MLRTASLPCMACLCVSWPGSAWAESERQEELRTGEAETAEPLTEEPLKAVLQNLILQEDVFSQPHRDTQLTTRWSLAEESDAPALDGSLAVEHGLGDAWTISLRAPLRLLPTDERGLDNVGLGLLYTFWVSRNEDFRFSAFLDTALPSWSSAGQKATAHDATMIGYVRLAPVHLQATVTLDVSYGDDVAGGARARPEGALAAIVKLDEYAVIVESAAQRSFNDLSYLASLALFWYPGSFEVGVASRADLTEWPPSFGGLGLLSYAFEPDG